MFLYVLDHYHFLEDGFPERKSIGIYTSRERALEAYERLKVMPGFSDYPALVDWENDESANDETDGFHLGTNILDQDSWVEGFIVV